MWPSAGTVWRAPAELIRNLHPFRKALTHPVLLGGMARVLLVLVLHVANVFSLVLGLMDVAGNAGATTMCKTAQQNGAAPRAADHVICIPAQTMANDRSGTTSVLPMGSLFEAAQLLFFKLVVLELRDTMGVCPEAMRANHTNLE